ncbi:MAG: flavodoxin family protein [Clostridiales bacterium]|nr:flavodoxin family protein [Clostridiales bacterium]
MKALAINGSARKNGNTAALLKSALEGSASVGAETSLVHLYDLNYRGCTGCVACKLLGGSSFGSCAQRDDLTQILEQAKNADVLFLGSPMYFNDVTGQLRGFFERFLFPAITYTKERVILYPKRVSVGLCFTSNAPGSFYTDFYERLKNTFTHIIGPAEYVEASETWQFDDYSKYAADMFDVEARLKRHLEVFPEDCKKAYEMGRRLASAQ